MTNKLLIAIAFIFVGTIGSAWAAYDSLPDCRKSWEVCAVGFEDGQRSQYVEMLQIGNETMALRDLRQLQIQADGKIIFLSEAGPLLIGSFGEKNENGSVHELILNPEIELVLTRKAGADAAVCNPVDGPIGRLLYQYDYLHTKLYQLQIVRNGEIAGEINSVYPQLVYPAYASKVSRLPCP